MKRLVSMMLMLALVGFTSVAFAAPGKPSHDVQFSCISESANTVLGKVVSLNHDSNTITVADQETDMNKTFVAGSRDLANIREGQIVKVVLLPGSANQAGSVENLVPDPGHHSR